MEIALLDETKTINQLIVADVDKSILEFICSELSKDEFCFVVTADNLKFAKDKMADLNKSITFITDFRKQKVDDESIAIDSFKENVKEYARLINEKREQIKKDVEFFETETKKAIEKELSLYVENLIKSYSLRDGFNVVVYHDLVAFGAVTAKGSLTKKTCEILDGRVMAHKSKQDKYDMRLLQLENASHRACLESPLTITHVQGIINIDSDAEYQTRLESLIASEIDRQNVIKENLRINAEKEKKALEVLIDTGAIPNQEHILQTVENVQQKLAAYSAAPMQDVELAVERLNESTITSDGKRVFTITATFEILAPDHTPHERITAKLQGMIESAGITSLKSIEVM